MITTLDIVGAFVLGMMFTALSVGAYIGWGLRQKWLRTILLKTLHRDYPRDYRSICMQLESEAFHEAHRLIRDDMSGHKTDDNERASR